MENPLPGELASAPPPLPIAEEPLVAVDAVEQPPGPRLGKALLASLIFYVVVIAVSIPVAMYYALSHQMPDTLFITLVGQVVGWPVVLWVGLLLINRPWSGSYAIKTFPPSLTPGLVIGCFGLTIVLSAITALIPMSEPIRETFQSLSDGNAAMYLVAITLIAPIAEELFFRGWMLRGFLANYSAAKSIWLTAIIFALFHLNPWQAVVALPLGLLFGWLVLRTGSLAPGIIGHFVVNFSASYLLTPFAMLLGHSEEQLQQQDQLPGDVVLAGVMLSVAGLAWVAKSVRMSGTPVAVATV